VVGIDTVVVPVEVPETSLVTVTVAGLSDMLKLVELALLSKYPSI